VDGKYDLVKIDYAADTEEIESKLATAAASKAPKKIVVCVEY
jgi:hypothetical protein